MNGLRSLSVGQEALWLLYKLAPDSAAYNDAGAGLLSPAPDVEALSAAVRVLTGRHDLLRCVFTEVDGVPVRRVLDQGVDLEVRDASGLDDAGLRGAARELALTPFRLETAGPLRVVLLHRGPDALLLVGNHHIATDATSQWLIWQDLLRAYRALAAGRQPDLPPPGGSYDEYVESERRLLESPEVVRMEEYWRGVCAGAVAAELPGDRPRPARAGLAGATRTRPLDPDLADRLGTAAAGFAVTPFAVLLGAFQAMLYRYTAQSDFLLGCPTSTRRTRRTRDVVGYFVNTLLLRARLDRDTTFADAVRDAGRQIVQGSAHGRYPFPTLLRTLGRATGPGAAPLFRIAMTMVTASRFDATVDRLADGESDVSDAGMRLSTVDVPRLEGQYDLNVEITRSSSSTTLVFRYNTDLFDAGTIDRLLDTYLRFIRVAVTDPSRRVSRVSLVDDAERAKLLALGVGAVGSV